jgi:Arc/MetJ-type ribon-helix-helix transcriptional regulator
MARRRLPVAVSIPEEQVHWMDDQVKKRKFSTRSHCIEVALLELRRSTEAQNRSGSRT